MANSESISVRSFDRNKVTLEKEIGSGSFGKVYLATIADTKLPPVAVKVFWKELKKDVISQKAKDNAYEELLKLAVIDHENIVKLHGMVEDELPWLVFEYMRDGNLLEYVFKNDNIKEKTLIRFCRDICNGMAFLHSHHVLHKDLAARNILLNDRIAKIADLGLSSFLTDDEEGIYALNGKLFPFRHAARECIVEQVYTFESDVWSFGVLMYEVFTGGSTPYGKQNKQPEVRRFIVDRITPLHLREPQCSSKIYSIMKAVLNPIIEERPTFDRLLNKFQKLLTGKPMADQHQPLQQINKDSSAFLTFHKIKANGLSASINDLQNSNSTTSSNEAILVSQSPKNSQHNLDIKQRQHLTVSNNLRSSSTPNIVDAIAAASTTKSLKSDNFQQATPNFLSVRSFQGRRHSEQIVSEIPLGVQINDKEQLGKVDHPSATTNDPDPDEHSDEPRRRAYSNSRTLDRNNPLLQGFVQNRFTRKS